jgi:molybdopterin synthase catalytic subunit
VADDTEAIIAVEVSETPLDVEAAIAKASGPAIGGIGVFVGTVRDSSSVETNSRKPVVALDYDSHPSLAEQRLRAIVAEAATKWDLRRVVAIHRTGHCELGEATVVVAAGAPHRGDALEACRWIIDTIKSTVPIWKREAYADGSAWVGDNA